VAIEHRISKLKKRLDSIEKKLKSYAVEISSATKTDLKYWSGLRKKISNTYEESRVAFSKWSKINLSGYYNEELNTQIQRIKGLTFKTKTIDFNTYKNKSLNKKSISKMTTNANQKFIIGTILGEERFNRVLRTTQQINISNKKIEKRLTQTTSINNLRKRIQNDLMKNLLDNKFVNIIDKNVKQRSYDVKYYADMVARTEMRNLQTASVVNAAAGVDGDLVQVSSHNTKTPFDAQFEGKIFSLSGKDKDFPKADFLPPFHPNCWHVITVVFKEGLEANGTLDKKIKESSKSIYIPENKKEDLNKQKNLRGF
jgi:hypothetical protein